MGNNTKKNGIGLAVFLICVFLLGFGITYSVYSLISQAQNDSTKIYSGKMDIDFIQGNNVSTDILFPIDEPKYETIRNVYKNSFSVSTTGTLEQIATINFKMTESNFKDDSIKYKLFNSQKKVIASGYLNKNTTVLADDLYFKPTDKRDFMLMIWLDNNKKDQNLEQGKELKGTIVINSTQFKK